MLGWYPATEAILQRGVQRERTSSAFLLDSEHVVEPLALRDVHSKALLYEQLHDSKVVVVEMQELDAEEAAAAADRAAAE